jgi:DMSO/TMAO reductase YedYZ heme-binding membrane subunit
MTAQLPWYVARAAGIVAWALLTGSVLWGLAMTTRTFKRRVRRPWLLDLHRFLGGLALVFTVVHVAAILADTYVHFGLAEVLVPLASRWHPVAVAFGIVGFYLLAAVEVSSLARAHLPHSLWRRVHFLSFPLYVVTTVHLLTAGTDRHQAALLAAVVVSTGAIVALVAVRVNRDIAAVAARRAGPTPARSPRPSREPAGRPGPPRATRPAGSEPASAVRPRTATGPSMHPRHARRAGEPVPERHP